MTPATSSFPICPVCGSSGVTCPHCTDLNRAAPMFDEPGRAAPMFDEPGRAANELHEFQFFRHDDNTETWMFNEPKDTTRQQEGEMQLGLAPQLVAPPFNYLDSLNEAFNVVPGHGLSFEFRPKPAEPAAEYLLAVGHAAASSATIVMESKFTVEASSGINKEIICDPYSGDLSGRLYHEVACMEREAKVRRYKEKRQKRKYKKQIRYSSRKAYAEMRPRINGRFAKIHEKTSSSSSSQQPAPDDPPFVLCSTT